MSYIVDPTLIAYFYTSGEGVVNPTAATLPDYLLTSPTSIPQVEFPTGGGVVSLNALTGGMSLTGQFPPPIGGKGGSAFGRGF